MTDTRPDTIKCPGCGKSRKAPAKAVTSSCRSCGAVVELQGGAWIVDTKTSSAAVPAKPMRKAKKPEQPVVSHALAIEGNPKQQKCPYCAEKIHRPRKFMHYQRCKHCLHGLELSEGYLEKPKRLAKKQHTVKLSCSSCREYTLCAKHAATVRCRFCNAILTNRKKPGKIPSIFRSGSKTGAAPRMEGSLLSRAFSLFVPKLAPGEELGFLRFLGYVAGIAAGLFSATYFEATSLANWLAPLGWAAYIAVAITTVIVFAVLVALVVRHRSSAEFMVSNVTLLLIAGAFAFDIPNPNSNLRRGYAEIARTAIDAKDHGKAAEAFGQAAAAAGADGDLDALDDMLHAQFNQRRKVKKK